MESADGEKTSSRVTVEFRWYHIECLLYVYIYIYLVGGNSDRSNEYYSNKSNPITHCRTEDKIFRGGHKHRNIKLFRNIRYFEY